MSKMNRPREARELEKVVAKCMLMRRRVYNAHEQYHLSPSHEAVSIRTSYGFESIAHDISTWCGMPEYAVNTQGREERRA
jgi:hypothetical protein